YAWLQIRLLGMHGQELLDRTPRGRTLRMIRWVAQRVVHHHAVGHRRIDRAEAGLAVEPLADPGDRGLDRELVLLFRKHRRAPPQQVVGGTEEPEQRGVLLRG